MRKNVLMTISVVILVTSMAIVFTGQVNAPLNSQMNQKALSAVTDPGQLPNWHDNAQVSLGWIFDNPLEPQLTSPLIGWDIAIGDIPSWNYDSARTVEGDQPAQWYIQILNLDNDNPIKKFWISWIYEFDSTITGPRSATNIDWSPETTYDNFQNIEEWFTSAGVPTDDHLVATYARVTINVNLYPNPGYEDVWLGVLGAGKKALAVYIETYCIEEIEPEPIVIGPGELPEWHNEAQVQLGWTFDDPLNPQMTSPLVGWDIAIDYIPEWNYDSDRIFNDQPAQWYIQIPNLQNDNPSKKMWISWVYDFDPNLNDPQSATNIFWEPNTGMDNTFMIEEWFNSEGILTAERSEAAYARLTGGIELFPNPSYEEVWLGLFDETMYAREVYLKTLCVEEEPEPIPETEIAVNLRVGVYYGEDLRIDTKIKLDNNKIDMDIDVIQNNGYLYYSTVKTDFTQDMQGTFIMVLIEITRIDDPSINVNIYIVLQLSDSAMDINTDINQNGSYTDIEIVTDINIEGSST